ncbi:30S ribosomal protein S9 [Candidatus Beckwithbacteria bacterium CG10_big_fil_rev_8_21_14_0_10_34_10]|uniref:Small ribosomal subunit protein uS9 n=1 Tax=Candidatus Beckwithbacteria bacterium CG10_big_fil_rev_8_21_14_0_10_34_10 TaxID=1974495 RepID=A0A2H0W7X7_9BACT|nr:MAG: 30S ribosomal protein S9 [Candidatus Beckwithbacteria bacterium CG10_big_fil_rev_8_21_14_0_10_34_10]
MVKKIKNKKVDYIYALGRRRRASARIRFYPKTKGEMIVNDMPVYEYFPGPVLKKIYLQPLSLCSLEGKNLITVKVVGSGKMGQLGAVTQGISRALVKLDKEKYRPILKKNGLLTRDPREKERRKAGMGGKARRKKQSPRR